MNETFDPTRPIFLQIMEAIKKRTLKRVLGPGDPLPSVREMAKRMGVNPNTMARAYMELERERFITTKRGTGSFITGDVNRIDRERRNYVTRIGDAFLADLAEMGLDDEEIDGLLERLKSQAVAAVGNQGGGARD